MQHEPDQSLCLALQGGGALGAFTWGVLDGLLCRQTAIEAISGASAGAVNAVVLASGYLANGPQGARDKLSGFWRRLSAMSPAGAGASAALRGLSALSIDPSPALMNPLGFNPLARVLEEAVDFAELRRSSPIALFVSATRVRDGAARIFRTDEITLDVVLASSCLPQFQRAVEIDGESYWDGGFSANPPLLELLRHTASRDLLVVELANAIPDTTSGAQIVQRLQQISLSASLQRELQTVASFQELVEGDPGAQSAIAQRMRGLRVHRLCAEKHLDLRSGDERDLAPGRQGQMFEAGVSAAAGWLPKWVETRAAAA